MLDKLHTFYFRYLIWELLYPTKTLAQPRQELSCEDYEKIKQQFINREPDVQQQKREPAN